MQETCWGKKLFLKEFLLNFTKILKTSNFLQNFNKGHCDFRAVQRNALCRSRRELSNAYLLAKFGFETAENEPSKVCRWSRTRSDAAKKRGRAPGRSPGRSSLGPDEPEAEVEAGQREAMFFKILF